MLRFAVALAGYAIRLILPIIIGLTSLGVALTLGIFPLRGTVSQAPDVCTRLWLGGACVLAYQRPYAWQMPVAILIGVVGLGLAALIAFWNVRHPRPRPARPVSRGWQPSASESMLRFRI